MKHKKTILMVDDDVDFTKMAKMLLEKTGLYEVGVCNESTAAVEWIRGWKPDLILLDVVMPNVDGGEIAAILQKDKDLCSIPLVFMTSLMTAEEAAQNPLIAKHRFISKPISGQTLLDRVRGFLVPHDI